jgi:thiamine biosynthesis lipoprotein
MGITLDGIAKGYIVDQAIALLKARGMARVLVEAGGDLSLHGLRQDGHPWRVGIHHPRALAGYYQVLEQSNGAMATSGDYEAAFTADFRYHHIIDPRTGSSPASLSSATVLASNAASADALSTAAMVLGMTEGLELLERLAGVEALLIDKQVTSRATSGFPAPSI